MKDKPAVTLDDTPTVSSTTTIAQTLSSTATRVSSARTPTLSPSSTASPSPASRPDASNLQLAFVDSEGDIALVGYDGSNKKKLIGNEQCPKPMKLIWSPTGDKLACLSYEHIETTYEQNRAWPLSRYTVVIADVEGHLLGKIGPLESFTWSFAWSPSGQHIAYGVVITTTPDSARGLGTPMETYYVADFTGKTIAQLQGGERWLTNDLLQGIQGNLIWSPDGSRLAYNADSGETAIYELKTKGTMGLGEGTSRPLAWVMDGKMLLVASKYDPGAMLPRYEANLLDLATGQAKRVPDLDNSRRFWLSPDGIRAAFLYWERSRRSFAGLAMLDFATLAVTPIPDSIIRFPSETVPYDRASFSRDGLFFAWVDWAGGAMDVYRVRANGTEMRKLVSLTGMLAFSPDLKKIAFDQSMVKVLDLDGSSALEIGPGATVVWRP